MTYPDPDRSMHFLERRRSSLLVPPGMERIWGSYIKAKKCFIEGYDHSQAEIDIAEEITWLQYLSLDSLLKQGQRVLELSGRLSTMTRSDKFLQERRSLVMLVDTVRFYIKRYHEGVCEDCCDDDDSDDDGDVYA